MNWRLVVPLTAIAVFAFPLTAGATPDDQSTGPARMERMQHWAADREAVLEAKLAGMKAGLKLNPDQEKLWSPFESAVLDIAKARMDAMQKMMEARESHERRSPIDHLDAMADRLSQAATNAKKIAEAAKPLYDSLDESQKHSFGTLGRMLMPERERFAEQMWHRHEGSGMPE
jgi:hypothetical protein